jgi:glucokinase
MAQRQANDAQELSPCAIGLDVGGTKVAGGVIGPDGQIAFHHTTPTRAARGGEAVADDVFELAERLMLEAKKSQLQPAAIGISLCELVDAAGEIVSGETIPWRTEAIRTRFSQLAPTVFEADSRAAALAEARHGAGRDWSNFLYVTIGSGISCCLVIDGRPYLGARGLTGTMASGPLSVFCGECGKLATAVVEQIASGPALARRYNERAGATVVGAEAVLAAAQQGHSLAREVIETAAESLGSLVALLVSVVDPGAVVIGGGLGSAPGAYWEALQASIRRHIWSDRHRQLPIVQGRFGSPAGMVGAGLFALESLAAQSKN